MREYISSSQKHVPCVKGTKVPIEFTPSRSAVSCSVQQPVRQRGVVLRKLSVGHGRTDGQSGARARRSDTLYDMMQRCQRESVSALAKGACKANSVQPKGSGRKKQCDVTESAYPSNNTSSHLEDRHRYDVEAEGLINTSVDSNICAGVQPNVDFPHALHRASDVYDDGSSEECEAELEQWSHIDDSYHSPVCVVSTVYEYHQVQMDASEERARAMARFKAAETLFLKAQADGSLQSFHVLSPPTPIHEPVSGCGFCVRVLGDGNCSVNAIAAGVSTTEARTRVWPADLSQLPDCVQVLMQDNEWWGRVGARYRAMSSSREDIVAAGAILRSKLLQSHACDLKNVRFGHSLDKYSLNAIAKASGIAVVLCARLTNLGGSARRGRCHLWCSRPRRGAMDPPWGWPL